MFTPCQLGRSAIALVFEKVCHNKKRDAGDKLSQIPEGTQVNLPFAGYYTPTALRHLKTMELPERTSRISEKVCRYKDRKYFSLCSIKPIERVYLRYTRSIPGAIFIRFNYGF